MNTTTSLLWAASLFQFASPLSGAGWAALAIVPFGILLLYFLKLKRRPVQVPSTLLWKRSLEDLHVNSLFQRLRRNLLLFLQLLIVGLAMLALSGMKMWGKDRAPERIVLAIDESASIGTTDVEPNRLAVARAKAKKIIQEMQPGDLTMIVAFSDAARVVTNYTTNQNLLLQRLEAIRPTERGTSLREALQLVAGLANPQKQVGEGEVATAVMPPKLYLFTDGGFPDVEGFSLGNIEPEIVVIGPPPQPIERTTRGIEEQIRPASDNVAILALDTARDKNDPDRFHVFGRVRNYRNEAVRTRARLLRHDPLDPNKAGVLLDAVSLSLDPRADQGFEFDLAEPGGGALEVDLEVDDALPVDNHAFAAYGRPHKAQVLMVTPGNRFLNDVLGTTDAQKLADVTEISPDDLASDEITRDLLSSQFDLVIFDRARPETSPEANALYFGALPPSMNDVPSRNVEYPVILDWDVSHPLLQYIRDLGGVVIREGVVVEPPRSASELIQTSEGPIAFTVPRGGYIDAVISFPLVEGGKPNTNWPLMYSFPIIMLNTLRVLGHAADASTAASTQPGQPVTIRPDGPIEQVEVLDPSGQTRTLRRSPQGGFVDTQANRTGLYLSRWDDDQSQVYAVNLFDPLESNLAPRGQVPPGVPDDQADQYRIKIGYNPVQATRLDTPTEHEWWWPLTLVALGVLLVEWYIYNRRVYV